MQPLHPKPQIVITFNRPVSNEERTHMRIGMMSIRIKTSKTTHKCIECTIPCNACTNDTGSQSNDVCFDYTNNSRAPESPTLTPDDIQTIMDMVLELWGVSDPDLTPVTIKNFKFLFQNKINITTFDTKTDTFLITSDGKTTECTATADALRNRFRIMIE